MDTTILAEAPKLAGFKATMRHNLSKTLQIKPDQVNIKATTSEGLGIIGKGEAIAAMSVVLVSERFL